MEQSSMKGASPCPSGEDWWRFLLGQLAEAETDRLERHLGGCRACVEVLATLRPQDELLEIVAGVARRRPSVDEDVRAGLLQALCRLPEAGTDLLAGSQETPLGPLANLELSALSAFLAPPRDPDEVGRFGPYGILRVLGAGGMGVVFAAQQDRPRRVVALKLIAPASLVKGERLARFRAETELIARLQHPNIVPILEVGEQGGRPYFTMEYLAGGNLAQKLAVAPLTPRAAAELGRTLARAVQFAHEQGIVHRDLKPANVLLTTTGAPKIADFGLAKQLEGEAGADATRNQTESGVILGTPSYIAPEQALGRSQEIGPACDVYALGAILYETLTGRPPFKAATILETLEQVRTAEPVPPGRLQPGVPRDLQTICLKCLAKEPARRYRSAKEVADDLDRFLRGEPIQARPVPVWERAWKWTRRNLTLAVLLLVCLLSLVALGIVSLAYQARLRAEVARAEKQWERAEAEKAEAQRQQQLARDRYQLAHDVIDRMVLRGMGLRPADAWRLQKLCEDRLEFFRTLQGADAPEIRLDMADSLLALGHLQIRFNQMKLAVEYSRQAIALMEGLPEELRLQPYCQDRLANAHTLLADLAERQDEKEHGYRQVLAIRTRLAEADPENLDCQHRLAHAELLLGIVHRTASRWTEAEALSIRARSRYARLADARPGELTYRDQLATCWVNLGHLYHLMRCPDRAGAAFARAEELLAQLTALHPGEPQYRLSLAEVETVWANFLTETGQPEAGWQRASRAVDLAGPLLRDEQWQASARVRAGEAHLKRARACEGLGRWADAVKDWGRTIELKEGPKLGDRRHRANALARAGAYARAIAEVQALEKEPGLSAEYLLELACICARAVEPSRSDTRLPEAERTALAERCGRQAVLLLTKLHAKGYFKDADHARWLKTSPDLQPLRGRIDFWLLQTARKIQ
jgi:tetratricopeptide (TPR) repeat protein